MYNKSPIYDKEEGEALGRERGRGRGREKGKGKGKEREKGDKLGYQKALVYQG